MLIVNSNALGANISYYGGYNYTPTGNLPAPAAQYEPYTANGDPETYVQYDASTKIYNSAVLVYGGSVYVCAIFPGASIVRGYYGNGAWTSWNCQVNGGHNAYYCGTITPITVGGVQILTTAGLQLGTFVDTDMPYFESPSEYMEFITHTATSYVWTSVEAISGDMGILSLSQITDEGIGDGITLHINEDISNILRFTDQSNLRILVQNLTNDVEQSIIQAGRNRLTATVHHNSSSSYSVTLKFYLKQGEGSLQTESMIFSTSILMVYNNEVITYLSFIIDHEQGVARFDPIYLINQPGTTYHNTVEYNNVSHTDTDMVALYNWLMSSDDLNDDESPYDTGTEDDGGDGFPAQPQDHIGLPNLPTLGGLNLGLVTLYRPTDTQLTQLAQFLWDSSTIEDFKKYFNNFADNLLGLYVLPYKATQLATKNLIVGGMDSGITGVEYVSARFVDIDMGSFEITPRWKSYLSFAPYTKIDIYLPYCGTHSLDTDEVMCPADSDGYLTQSLGSTLKLNYRLDLCTGNIVATLFINGESRYQFTGKCGHNIPLTGQSYTNLVTGGIQAAAGLATTILSGGMTAPLSLNAAVSGTIMAQKPEVYRSGNLSGDVSSLGYDTPYLIKTTPNKPKLENQQYYTGFPSYKKSNLGSFSGYTEVIEAHIDTISCTSEERDMIMAALKGGVII